MDPDLFRVALRAIFAPVVAEIPDQFLFLGVDGDHRLLFSQSGGYLAVDIAELRIPVGVAVALRGLAVALQTVTCLIEQVADQGAADFVTLRLQRLRQTAHALAGPPQRRFRIPAGRRLDQGFEIGEQRRVLGNRRLAPRSRPPNPFRRLILRQFLQAPPDRARRNPSRHRDRRDPTITRSECLRRRDQTTAPFIEKRGHRRKPLSDRFDIDHHHNIWYSNLVVNPYITLSKVDSIIYGRALSACGLACQGWGRVWAHASALPRRLQHLRQYIFNRLRRNLQSLKTGSAWLWDVVFPHQFDLISGDRRSRQSF